MNLPRHHILPPVASRKFTREKMQSDGFRRLHSCTAQRGGHGCSRSRRRSCSSPYGGPSISRCFVAALHAWPWQLTRHPQPDERVHSSGNRLEQHPAVVGAVAAPSRADGAAAARAPSPSSARCSSYLRRTAAAADVAHIHMDATRRPENQ